MRILFATVAALRQEATGLTSDLASARYRVIVPAQELARLGHTVQIASLPAGGWPAEVLEAPCDGVVVSKSFHAPNEALAEAMKRRGVRVAVDFCDDHFEDARLGPHFRRLAALADTVVAGSEAMAASVRAHTGREARVVSDPVEGPRGEPRFDPDGARLRLAWFGHPSNLPAIAANAQALHALARRMPVHLEVVTHPSGDAHALLTRAVAPVGEALAFSLTPGSREATWRALARCDAAWIPVEAAANKAVKSPNRLLEAAWAGRFVVADALPAYRAWSDVLAVGEPLDEAIAAALGDRAGTASRIDAAQERIAVRHSPAACGAEWALALGAGAPELAAQYDAKRTLSSTPRRGAS